MKKDKLVKGTKLTESEYEEIFGQWICQTCKRKDEGCHWFGLQMIGKMVILKGCELYIKK